MIVDRWDGLALGLQSGVSVSATRDLEPGYT
jgi:hypothetical protein